MKNHYLYIKNQKDGKIDLSAFDGVFGYSATCDDKEDFIKYCDEKVDMWLNSTFGNFEGWTKQKRQSIAHKWAIAKNRPEGKYDYFFNFGTIQDIFREEVAVLAKNMGITNYNLTVE